MVFQIGRFARLAGVSAKQLRAYDEIGLFRPVWVDPSSAYRYYSPAQLPELRRILGLRQLGMPIEEIKRLATGGDLAEALQRRRAELEVERRRVQERLAALEISVADDAAVDVVVRPVAADTVAVMTVGEGVGQAFHELESYVRDRGRRAHRPPGAFPEAREIFVPITGPIDETDRIGVRRLPAWRRRVTGCCSGWRRPASRLMDRCGRSTSSSGQNPTCSSRRGGSWNATRTS